MNWFLAHWTYSHLVLSNSTSHIKLDVTGLSLQKLAEQEQKKIYRKQKIDNSILSSNLVPIVFKSHILIVCE